MRGKPVLLVAVMAIIRIIPAHAGQTDGSSHSTQDTSDHPRACGANEKALDNYANGNGSSPRMRGKRVTDANDAARVRIIPAHAGQTACGERSTFAATDHPRACGANLADIDKAYDVNGSSPRMRGKLPAYANPQQMVRIIPAHAGQTPYPPTWSRYRSDHPRACGANLGKLSVILAHHGSSPRMRGKLHRQSKK